MEWSGCMSLLQGYLENSPLIVLGSGASMPYELPSMGGLAEEIRKSDTVISDPNYSAFCTAVDNSGLEGAIDAVNLLPETLHEIRRVVWKTVNEKDLLYFDQHPIDPPKALVELCWNIIIFSNSIKDNGPNNGSTESEQGYSIQSCTGYERD